MTETDTHLNHTDTINVLINKLNTTSGV